MRDTRPNADERRRLVRALWFGGRWGWVYWPCYVSDGARRIAVASVTPRLVELIEQRALTVPHVAKMLAVRVSGDSLAGFTAYEDLYDGALRMLLAMRRDIREARTSGACAVTAALEGDWAAALRFSVHACSIEQAHAEQTHYWGGLLALMRRFAVPSAHERSAA